MDGQTDGSIMAKTTLHTMQCGRNLLTLLLTLILLLLLLISIELQCAVSRIKHESEHCNLIP